MVSSERTFLTKLRDRGVDDPKATLIRLETLIQQYPYFQPLHRLGWQIAEKHALKKAPSFLTSCAVHTKNRLHLIKSPAGEADRVKIAQQNRTGDEVMSFVDWLNQIDDVIPKETSHEKLIDKFITDTPKIDLVKDEQKSVDLTKKQQFDDIYNWQYIPF